LGHGGEDDIAVFSCIVNCMSQSESILRHGGEDDLAVSFEF
jgi:hypothetical protein